MKKTLWFLIGLLIVVIFYSACSSANITSSWSAKNVNTHTGEINKILVLGVFNNKDRALREKIEQEFKARLVKEGYEAASSFEEYGPVYFEKMDESMALQKLKYKNIDAVLTITLLNKDKEERYVRGSIYPSFFTLYNSFWGYYNTYYPIIYDPGYYTTTTNYFFETNLYTLTNKDNLLYSVQSRSFEPTSASSLATDYSRAIIQDMKKKGVIR